MPVTHINHVEAQPITAGTGSSIQVLIAPQDGPNFAMRRIVIQPGGGMPNHTNQVEHEQYVLSGRATIGIGDEVFEVQAGNVALIPAGVPHWYHNDGGEDFVFLCLVPNKPDTITLVDEA